MIMTYHLKWEGFSIDSNYLFSFYKFLRNFVSICKYVEEEGVPQFFQLHAKNCSGLSSEIIFDDPWAEC